MSQLPDGTQPPKLPHGAYARIARRLRPQVTAEAVRLVYLGRSTSARITAAIETYRRSLPVEHPAHVSTHTSAPDAAESSEAHTRAVA